MEIKIGQGYDIHKLVEGRKLLIGGVEIACNKGALGHSDADVLIHAIIDSILGALNLGDIGQHFPDNDSEYKDISSIVLLNKTLKLMKNERYKIINLDSTIKLQEPKLKPYISQIKQNLSNILNAQVSVKAKTMEGLNAVGQGNAIEADVVVLLKKI